MEQSPKRTDEPRLSAKSFGERLTLLREASGLSPSALGASIGVSQVTIWNWENGRKYPRPAKLDDLAKALNTSVCTLSRGQEEMPSAPQDLARASFGERLSMLRKARRLSLAELGSNIGVSHVTVWNWENGKGRPDWQRLQDLAHQLHVSVSFLASGEGEPILELDYLRQSQLERLVILAREMIAKAAGVPLAAVTINVHHD
jgi:transcriptional regulator with XRE-family HTH domain